MKRINGLESINQINPNAWYQPLQLSRTPEWKRLYHERYIHMLVNSGEIPSIRNGKRQLVKGSDFLEHWYDGLTAEEIEQDYNERMKSNNAESAKESSLNHAKSG